MISYKGWYRIKNRAKCFNKSNKIYFKSKMEFEVMRHLDLSDGVKKWGYETKVIKYYDPVKKKIRNYIMDFEIQLIDNRLELWEVKSLKMANGKTSKKKSNRYNEEIIRNQAKWESVVKYIKKHNYKFRIVGR